MCTECCALNVVSVFVISVCSCVCGFMHLWAYVIVCSALNMGFRTFVLGVCVSVYTVECLCGYVLV